MGVTPVEIPGHLSDDAALLIRVRGWLGSSTMRTPDFAHLVRCAGCGVDISLVRFQPYKRPTGEVLVTFSTLFPLPDLERSLISPGEAAAEVSRTKLPSLEWTTNDLVKLGQLANLTTRATLDLCSEQAGVAVSLTQVVEGAGVARPVARAQLAGLTQLVKRRFGRRNWPFTVKWDVDSSGQAFYVITEQIAARWHEALVTRRRQSLHDLIAGTVVGLNSTQADTTVDPTENDSRPLSVDPLAVDSE